MNKGFAYPLIRDT